MSISLANLRSELLIHLGATLSDFINGNTDLDLLINRSWWEIMDKLDFREKEASHTYNTVAGTNIITIATLLGSSSIFDAIRKIGIAGPAADVIDTEEKVLDQMTLDVYNQVLNTDSSFQQIPTHYVRDGGNLILWPIPDDIYQLTVYYQAVLSDIPSLGPVVPQAWHEVILMGAIWRGWQRLGDYNKAYAMKKTQENMILTSTPVKAKELMDDDRAHLEVLGRDY